MKTWKRTMATTTYLKEGSIPKSWKYPCMFCVCPQLLFERLLSTQESSNKTVDVLRRPPWVRILLGKRFSNRCLPGNVYSLEFDIDEIKERRSIKPSSILNNYLTNCHINFEQTSGERSLKQTFLISGWALTIVSRRLMWGCSVKVHMKSSRETVWPI